jgi:pyrimidine deaminase RibD-like protein
MGQHIPLVPYAMLQADAMLAISLALSYAILMSQLPSVGAIVVSKAYVVFSQCLVFVTGAVAK